jgi:hypothetical protein
MSDELQRTDDRTGRLDLLILDGLKGLADLGSVFTGTNLWPHIEPTARRIVRENVTREPLTVERVAEELGLIDPRKR